MTQMDTLLTAGAQPSSPLHRKPDIDAQIDEATSQVWSVQADGDAVAKNAAQIRDSCWTRTPLKQPSRRQSKIL
jgi:hypothetical protein